MNDGSALAGRGADFDRLRDRLEGARIDVLALVWMLFVVLYTGVLIYQSLKTATLTGPLPVATDTWGKLGFLAQTGGVVLIFGSILAIAMAALFDTTASRLTLRLALIGGVWAVITAGIGVAVVFHLDQNSIEVSPERTRQILQALQDIAVGGLGLVVAIVAWKMSARPHPVPTPSAAPQFAEVG